MHRQAVPTPARRPHPVVKAVRIARSVAVVSGGPLTLAGAALVGPVAAARRWPDHLADPGARRAGWAVTGAAVALPGLYAALVRPWLQRWGSTPQERAMGLPGDPATRPWFTTTRAVSIDVPAEQVWPWLAQIGAERGGFYSYDWLENLAGCHLHSAEWVHPEWQDVKAGDPLAMTPEFGTRLEAVEPGRALVIENWGAYVVEPVDETRCRLLARSHVDRGVGGLAYVLAIELPHAIMERRMLLGIKERAERAAEVA